MRRVILFVGFVLLSVCVMAQEEMKQKFIKETKVMAPVFIGDENVNDTKATFNQYLVKELDYLKDDAYVLDEGIVSVNFKIQADGSLTDAMVVNSVSRALDRIVLKVVEKSNQLWLPGEINGNPTEMDQTVYVKFDLEGNPSHRIMAQNNLLMAVKDIRSIANINENVFLNANRKENKIQRKLNSAERFLCTAEKYRPDETSIVFWQARLYELQGEEELKNERLQKFNELAEQKMYEEELLNSNQLAVVKF
ncbi:energy transducer TonB [Carboxylicivirga linearis]|uniref:Energy transducer TonB n=1 Tax=Carboxylicivirga linearis TaxID=1628157 RepID=A0ABS5JT72_9BACT|nr:energy transducer TonB [Carboxylicivirga linearis]MBS2098018.1 energy transducer TonB [Carboxylicivirga linearis]